MAYEESESDDEFLELSSNSSDDSLRLTLATTQFHSVRMP